MTFFSRNKYIFFRSHPKATKLLESFHFSQQRNKILASSTKLNSIRSELSRKRRGRGINVIIRKRENFNYVVLLFFGRALCANDHVNDMLLSASRHEYHGSSLLLHRFARRPLPSLTAKNVRCHCIRMYMYYYYRDLNSVLCPARNGPDCWRVRNEGITEFEIYSKQFVSV